jgi:hypothetical protein
VRRRDCLEAALQVELSEALRPQHASQLDLQLAAFVLAVGQVMQAARVRAGATR